MISCVMLSIVSTPFSSVHTLDLVAFYVIICIYDTYCDFVGMTNVSNSLFGTYVCMLATSTQTVVNAAALTVLVFLCICTPFQVRRHKNTLFLIIVRKFRYHVRHNNSRLNNNSDIKTNLKCREAATKSSRRE